VSSLAPISKANYCYSKSLELLYQFLFHNPVPHWLPAAKYANASETFTLFYGYYVCFFYFAVVLVVEHFSAATLLGRVQTQSSATSTTCEANEGFNFFLTKAIHLVTLQHAKKRFVKDSSKEHAPERETQIVSKIYVNTRN